MKKLIVAVVIVIVSLNAVVLLPGLCSETKNVEESNVVNPRIELKGVKPGLIPNLLKF